MFERSSVLWKCDDCGGPAWWTVIDGAPHYYCKVQCAGFTQLPLDLGSEECYLDRVVSVSALDAEARGLPYNQRWDPRSGSSVPRWNLS